MGSRRRRPVLESKTTESQQGGGHVRKAENVRDAFNEINPKEERERERNDMTLRFTQ